MKRILLIFFIHFLVLNTAFPQKEGHIGIFGFGVGLDFNFSPPEVFVPEYAEDEHFQSKEGCAAVSDKEGNLLFYTNGLMVWNKQHKIMRNGREIQGERGTTSTTQLLIVPMPKDPFLFYIFTIGYQGGALKYSLVDMRLNNQLGEVIVKDQFVYDSATEKLSVVEHSSGEELWLISHEYGTDVFRSFLINENGLDTTYIESAVGAVHARNVEYINGKRYANTNAIGYLKASPDGKSVASAVYGEMSVVELFDFDKATGKVSHPRKLFENPAKGSYGLAFSPDGSKLYLSCVESKELFQFNLEAGSTQEIISSIQLISSDVSAALQLGPDQKIYVVGTLLGEYLDRINNPNALGASCGFEKDAVYLKGSQVYAGLPEFTYRLVKPEMLYQQACAGNETVFELYDTDQISTVHWDFGDPGSGNANYSSSLSPRHLYEKPGDYTVQVQVNYSNQQTQVFYKSISISSVTAELGKDIVLCEGATLSLAPNASGENIRYKWQDGSTSSSFFVDSPGKYWVEVSSKYCVVTDTINIEYLSSPEFEIKDAILCQGESLEVELNEYATAYSWDDGGEQGSRSISKSGNYKVTAINQCGSFSQEFKVTILPRLSLDLPKELFICENEEVFLNVYADSAQYLWQDGSTESEYSVSEEGIYWVKVYNKCEMLMDTVKINKLNAKDFSFPNVITPNGDNFNEYFVIDERLLGSRLSILNRWGEEVYFSPSYQNDWNGGGNSPGVYYYLLQENCSQKILKGPIQLLK
jgi:PKD repeat protein